MTSAKYGIYGSLVYYAALAVIASLSLVLVVFTDFLRALFVVTLPVSVALLILSLIVLFLISRRIGIVPQIVAAAKIRANDRVLDIGTGRGFLAIEIAKAVVDCRVVGIDVWGAPAKGEMHKGFLIGNSKENAERNASLEGVSDRVEFRQCDARHMPFESESFDVVVSSAALHQMIGPGMDRPRVLEEILRVLKPRGRLAMVEPMIGQRIAEKLREVGFRGIEVHKVANLGQVSFFMKMVSAMKVQ
jgi:SAM-dependent methyltransferase